jgi:hypothetical protein
MAIDPVTGVELTAAQFEQKKRETFAAWAKILGELLGWSVSQADAWTMRYDEFITDYYATFRHETLVYYLIPALIPESLRTRLEPHDMTILESRIQHAIEHMGGFPAAKAIVRDNTYDWAAARDRLQAILAEYGERLPGATAK